MPYVTRFTLPYALTKISHLNERDATLPRKQVVVEFRMIMA